MLQGQGYYFKKFVGVPKVMPTPASGPVSMTHLSFAHPCVHRIACTACAHQAMQCMPRVRRPHRAWNFLLTLLCAPPPPPPPPSISDLGTQGWGANKAIKPSTRPFKERHSWDRERGCLNAIGGRLPVRGPVLLCHLCRSNPWRNSRMAGREQKCSGKRRAMNPEKFSTPTRQRMQVRLFRGACAAVLPLTVRTGSLHIRTSGAAGQPPGADRIYLTLPAATQGVTVFGKGSAGKRKSKLVAPPAADQAAAAAAVVGNETATEPLPPADEQTQAAVDRPAWLVSRRRHSGASTPR